MEPQRGEEQLVRGAGGGGLNDDAGAAACFCPASIAGAARGPLFPPRHALEQEVLRRAELQLHVGGGDRRRERKMKNRASAARSRARSHAYVSELEKEVSLLQAENDELRKLCEEVKRHPNKRRPSVRLRLHATTREGEDRSSNAYSGRRRREGDAVDATSMARLRSKPKE